MTPPSWLELMVRMIAGEREEEPFVGLLEVSTYDEDSPWPSVVRVFKDRGRYRVEDLDGAVLTIRNDEHTFVFRTDGDDHRQDCDLPAGVPHRYDNDGDGEYRPGAHAEFIERRPPTDWRGDDFTTPTGPARATTHLGRDAWEVELAPPDHKPSPLVLTIDARHGMTYEQRSISFGTLSRWRELAIVESHADQLFEWHGECVYYEVGLREVTDQDEAEWERERAERVAELGLGPIELRLPARMHPHEMSEDGSLFVSLDVRADGVLLRRPTSPEAWETDIDYRFEDRWSDGTWDWCAASHRSVEMVAQIRRQLAEPRPEDA